jgi:hypothetical protein
MLTTGRLSTTLATGLLLLVGYLTAAVSAAGMPAPPDNSAYTPSQTVVVHHGSPAWTFVVVALAAAALTLAVTLLVSKLRRARLPQVQHA